MMGERGIDQAALFYQFSLERHVPADHMLRAIDRFVDLEGVRAHLAAFYSSTGRPSIDPLKMMPTACRAGNGAILALSVCDLSAMHGYGVWHQCRVWQKSHVVL